jgi:hypothetical protein
VGHSCDALADTRDVTDTQTLRTRAEYRNLTHAAICEEGCARFVFGSQKVPARVVVANVYVDPAGGVIATPTSPGSATWARTVIWHPDCYDNRYGPAEGSPDSPAPPETVTPRC